MIAPQPRLRRRVARRVTSAAPVGAASAATKGVVIPYDHGATFAITGRPGNIVQDIISISPDGVFVAVAIGYGFEEERGRSLALNAVRLSPSQGTPLPGDLTLGDFPPSALIEGFRVNPRFESLVFKSPGAANGVNGSFRDLEFSDIEVTRNLLFDDSGDTLFQRVKRSEEISFLFSILDSGSGRELQDEPTHNLASLGKSNGERPFRLLAQPITFLPRSTVRLQIIERTEGISGTLFIVLYGYKVVGSSACPETVTRALTGAPTCPVETVGRPSDRVIPFDYVTTIELSGRPKNLVENETTVSADGGFVATSVGYGLLVEEQKVPLQWERAFEVRSEPPLPAGEKPIAELAREWLAALAQRRRNPGAPLPRLSLSLRRLPLRLFPPDALLEGVRVRPELIRLAFGDNAQLATGFPLELLDELFERLNRPEDVSFRYTVFDSGRGRELQNQPLHNIAGLGIADGDRPFKRLARALVFLPRSTIRIQVEERFGRGKLFFVFQGYKILGPSLTGGRA